MAAGFKQATVNSARVPSTQSNFPVYIDLSRIGITTLAEAQSVRVYADSGKTTEWAREIVSATEMHVKVPSMTSTTSIYVDYDGVRSDYAATDTYGRNAVWSDYRAVYHFNTLTTDYTGNSYTLTNVNTVTTGTGLLGGSSGVAADFGSTNTNRSLRWTTDNMGIGASDAFTINAWAKLSQNVNGTQTYYCFFYKTIMGASGNETLTGTEWNGGTPRYWSNNFRSSNSNLNYNFTFGTTDWRKLTYTYTGSRWDGYLNGSQVMGATNSGTQNIGGTTRSFGLGEYGIGGGGFLRGLLDEVRVRAGALSADWETTEYNNQNNESDFWGTWSDVPTSTRGAILAFF